MITEDIKNEAIQLVDTERSQWEDSELQVTKRVFFRIKHAIETFRKNYWGVFDDENDEKIWIPLTEQAVEDSIKNFDLDLKDVQQIATNKRSIAFNQVARQIIKNKLSEKGFGEELDLAERALAIDGTVVWKTYKAKNKEGKMDLHFNIVDLLNFYIDPSAKSIQETDAVIERSIPTIDEFKRMEGLVDTEDVVGIDRVGTTHDIFATKTGQTKRVEVFERWGLMPKYFVTGDKENDTGLIEGRIVVSGTGSGAKLHLIARNPKGVKPYEEAWYTRVPGRWYGRGVAEKVMKFQIWANMVKNIHITRQKLAQLGVFKIKKSSGLTPKLLKGLSVNGAIQVNNMDDIEQMVMQEASQASYQDMNDIKAMVEGITSAVGAVSAESLSSSTATTSVINDRNNKSAFTVIREGIGMFISRWLDRHAKPIIFELTKVDDVIEIAGDDKAIDELIKQVVLGKAMEVLDQLYAKGIVPTEDELNVAIAKAQRDLKGKDLLLTLEDICEAGDFKTRTVITNEEIDISITVQNIISMLPYIGPESMQEYVRTVFDLMGVQAPAMQAPQQPIQGATSPATATQTTQSIATQALANTGQAVA